MKQQAHHIPRAQHRRGVNPASWCARRVAAVATCAVMMGVVSPAMGQLIRDELLPEMQGVGIVEHRGDMVPMDLAFTDATGRAFTFDECFDGKRPVLLVMSYYDCPVLCPTVLGNVQSALNGIDGWTAGDEFRVVTISFDHTDSPAQSLAKQREYLFGYDREDVPDDGWIFCTSDAANARKLASSVGFHYKYLPESGQFSHPGAIMFLTPDGAINTYMVSLEYPSRNVKLALMEAADGKVGSIFDKVVFHCYFYDPKTGEYVVSPQVVMRIVGGITLTLLGGTIAGLVVTNRRKAARQAAGMGARGHEGACVASGDAPFPEAESCGPRGCAGVDPVDPNELRREQR